MKDKNDFDRGEDLDAILDNWNKLHTTQSKADEAKPTPAAQAYEPYDEAAAETTTRLDIDSLLKDIEQERLAKSAVTLKAYKSSTQYGAEVARQTVDYVLSRDEEQPLVGDSAKTLRRRIELLCTLAIKQNGGHRAQTLVSAAELQEELADHMQAHALFSEAHEHDPLNVVAIRALRRFAIGAGDWATATEMLHIESQLPLGASDKAHVFLLLGEILARQRKELSGAEQAITHALRLTPDSAAAYLLLAEIQLQRQDNAGASDSIYNVATRLRGEPIYSLLLVDAATLAESAQQYDKALNYYQHALEHDATLIAAGLGSARCCRALGRNENAVNALLAAAGSTTSDYLKNIFLTSAAQWRDTLLDDGLNAFDMLRDVPGELPARISAQIARHMRDENRLQEALTSIAAKTAGTPRALALLELSRFQDLPLAQESVHEAALANSQLTAVQVAREALARKSNNAQKLAEAIDAVADKNANNAAVAAAKLGAQGKTTHQELELLEKAVGEGSHPLTVHTIGTDVAAFLREQTQIGVALNREIARTPDADRLGKLLAMAEAANDIGASHTEQLHRVRDWSSGDPHACRVLSLTPDQEPTIGSSFWEQEAAACGDTRSAFAWHCAANLVADDFERVQHACSRALEKSPRYLPAAWTMQTQHLDKADELRSALPYARFAEQDEDAATQWVRAALLNIGDPDSWASHLSDAQAAAPQDSMVALLLSARPCGSEHSNARHSWSNYCPTHPRSSIDRCVSLRVA